MKRVVGVAVAVRVNADEVEETVLAMSVPQGGS